MAEDAFELSGPKRDPEQEFVPTDTPVAVRITVQVGDVRKEFEAVAATNTDGFELANGMLSGLRTEASGWVDDQRRTC